MSNFKDFVKGEHNKQRKETIKKNVNDFFSFMEENIAIFIVLLCLFAIIYVIAADSTTSYATKIVSIDKVKSNFVNSSSDDEITYTMKIESTKDNISENIKIDSTEYVTYTKAFNSGKTMYEHKERSTFWLICFIYICLCILILIFKD